MALEFMLSLNEKEKAFIEQYQDLYIKHNGKEEIINAVLPFVVQNVDNYKNLINIIYDEIKKKLFCEKYKRDYSPAFVIKNDFLKFITEKDIDFSVKQIQFSFPSVAEFSSLKYRNNYLLSSGNDGIIRIWQFDKNKEQFFLFGEYGEKQTKESQFDLLNEYLFYSKDKSLIVYHIFSKKVVTKKEFAEVIEAIEFKNEKIIVYSEKVATNYIIKNNELFNDESVSFIELPNKTNLININENKYVIIFKNSVLFSENNKNSEGITEISLKTLSEHTSWVFDVAITSNGKNIVSVSRDETIKIWDISGTYLKTLYGHTHFILCVAITTNDKFIVSCSYDKTIKIWDFNGNCLNTLWGHTNYINAVAITPDNKNIVSGSWDQTVKIWDFNGNCLKTLTDHTDIVSSVAITPDGKNIVSGSWDETIKVWDFNGKCLKTLFGHKKIYSVAITPDGKNIVSGSADDTIKIWDFEGNCLKTLLGHYTYVLSVAITPNGKNIISGSEDKTIKIWDFEGNCLKTLNNHQRGVLSIAITPDGKNIVSGSDDKTIKICEIKQEENYKPIIKKTLILNNNPIIPIHGIQKFGDYLIIYYKNGKEICFNKKGEIIFTTTRENTENIKYSNLKQPRINFYSLENDFIIEKDGFYYGSVNWKNYLYFIENDKICLNNEEYDYYFDSIENNNLFEEI